MAERKETTILRISGREGNDGNKILLLETGGIYLILETDRKAGLVVGQERLNVHIQEYI